MSNNKLISLARESVNWGGRAVSLLLALTLIVALLPGASVPVVAARAQPILLQMAAEQPYATVGIIVQKTAQDSRVEDLVTALGGSVTKDLHIINAFAAQVEAHDVPQLARASGVRWVSLDAPMVDALCAQCISTSNLMNAYIRSIRADQVWNQAPYLQGQGVGVAVVDSGVDPHGDLIVGTGNIVTNVAFNTGDPGLNWTFYDGYGHGTHIAGIIGGDGLLSSGKYIGVAPKVNLINVKVSDDQGKATASSVVQGLQWINDNKALYNIRVVNLSLNSAVPEPYHTSPIDTAVEILWFNKVVVVASAGNQGSGALYPPANDPFIITVGAVDDRGTPSISDDVIPSFSAHGTTTDGFAKPDLVAPGKNIVSPQSITGRVIADAHPANLVNSYYFRMSGTSTAAPIVSGAVALLLQDEPGLTPDQVKYRLMATANKSWSGYSATQAGAGYLDIYAAVQGTTTDSANTGIPASQLLWTGSEPVTWNSVNWNSVNWNSVNWNSVNWNSVNWNSVNWNSDYWGP